MKFLSVLVLLITIATKGADAQPLQAHAGADTMKCPPSASHPVYPRLGAPATGGVPPYSYSWSIVGAPNPGTLLDSPNSAQPLVVQTPGQPVDSLFFVVQVTDAASTVARDTVKVLFPHWVFTAGSCIRFKGPGDTVSIGAQGGSLNFSPMVFEWVPNVYIDSVVIAGFGHQYRSFTPVTQNYFVYGTDRAGCRAIAGSCSVVVTPTRVPETTASKNAVCIVPSPATVESRFEISPGLLGSDLQVFSADGRLVRNQTLFSVSTPLRELMPSVPGLYFYVVGKHGRTLYRGHFATAQ